MGVGTTKTIDVRVAAVTGNQRRSCSVWSKRMINVLIVVLRAVAELQQKFNTALEKVKKDGTYETIYNKWFQK
ncbi:transporter substrate-binding domain-containing protein, partial [Salmonella enterica subsp. enterica serovar Montevideo]|nr:transporter substrate-binding domain-containing protein [Salmonella enterica subsp. enterica serovar Montevideo]